MENDQLIYIVSITIVAIVISIYYFKKIPGEIPIVVIAYNNLFFVRNFIDQLKYFKNPIIIFDNNSNYQPLLDYYEKIKSELGLKIDIRMLDKNYGCGVATVFKNTLPDIYILSDPDLELNPRMPENFSDILYELSIRHRAYKVGLALDISEPKKLLDCKNYEHDMTIVEWESHYWKKRIADNYEVYDAPTDTTFCLINPAYSEDTQIRIAGEFTAKHLPWYKGFLKEHISKEELEYWKRGNNSSSILLTCITD
uniref:Glycosyltransferase 2-like domain-containing protein n=1 Tax=viral metagenome TaxID=1070528 RepID=A0A6C0AMQ0_9ZZZZ